MENNLRLNRTCHLPEQTKNNLGRFCLVGFLVILTGAIALPSPAEKIASGDIVDRIVAIVNNDIILLSDVQKALAPYLKTIKERGLPDKTEETILSRAQADILDNLVDEKLVLQKADEWGIAAEEGEVDAALERVKGQMQYSEETFRSFLSEAGFTMDEYREQIGNQIVKNRLLTHAIKSKIVVTPEEIEDYFLKHKDEFPPGTRYHLKHIIMQIPERADEAGKASLRQQMEDIHQLIKNGVPFETIARRYSQSSVAVNGGDLGFFAQADLAPELKDVIVSTNEGEITPVIETDFGYQIFYIASVITNDGRLGDEISEKIHERLYSEKLDEKFNEWTSQLRGSAHISIIE